MKMLGVGLRQINPYEGNATIGPRINGWTIFGELIVQADQRMYAHKREKVL